MSSDKIPWVRTGLLPDPGPPKWLGDQLGIKLEGLGNIMKQPPTWTDPPFSSNKALKFVLISVFSKFTTLCRFIRRIFSETLLLLMLKFCSGLHWMMRKTLRTIFFDMDIYKPEIRNFDFSQYVNVTSHLLEGFPENIQMYSCWNFVLSCIGWGERHY